MIDDLIEIAYAQGAVRTAARAGNGVDEYELARIDCDRSTVTVAVRADGKFAKATTMVLSGSVPIHFKITRTWALRSSWKRHSWPLTRPRGESKTLMPGTSTNTKPRSSTSALRS